MRRTAIHTGWACSVLVCLGNTLAEANSAPEVTNVTASQRGDDSNLVDIAYDLADADGDPCTVWVSISDDGGTSWRVPARTFTGDIGQGVTPGSAKHVVWDAGADMPGAAGSFKTRVWADDGNGPGPMVLVPAGWFPPQNVSDPEQWDFMGTYLIDKYEVTNQFYCQFLNNADPNGDHWSSAQEIDRWGSQGSYTYTVHAGKEEFPIRYVHLYDAEAFASWRTGQDGVAYHLPTRHQWEKAAAWDPVENHYYTYGFHEDTISCDWCNYNPSTACVGTTSPVGYYDGTGGRENARSYYGCYDMSGNLWEWNNDAAGYIRGGAWDSPADHCQCAYRESVSSGSREPDIGFRLIRYLE